MWDKDWDIKYTFSTWGQWGTTGIPAIGKIQWGGEDSISTVQGWHRTDIPNRNGKLGPWHKKYDFFYILNIIILFNKLRKVNFEVQTVVGRRFHHFNIQKAALIMKYIKIFIFLAPCNTYSACYVIETCQLWGIPYWGVRVRGWGTQSWSTSYTSRTGRTHGPCTSRKSCMWIT